MINTYLSFKIFHKIRKLLLNELTQKTKLCLLSVIYTYIFMYISFRYIYVYIYLYVSFRYIHIYMIHISLIRSYKPKYVIE